MRVANLNGRLKLVVENGLIDVERSSKGLLLPSLRKVLIAGTNYWRGGPSSSAPRSRPTTSPNWDRPCPDRVRCSRLR